MSPLGRLIASFLCSLFIVKSASGAPTVVDRQRPGATGGGITLDPNSEGRLGCLHGSLTLMTDNWICHCDEGWTGYICNIPCTLKCIHGSCEIKPAGMRLVSVKLLTEEDMFCNCEKAYTNERCDEKIHDPVAQVERKTRKIVLGICLTAVVLTAIILPIVIWRKRIILSIRTVRFLKSKEDNDGKIYDAYVSAGTADKALTFVKDLLAPQLEQKGFKLLIPCRDVQCGAVISDDILTAIKHSRRIIMVVTPEYVQNDWNGFELLFAQDEMTTLQTQIIPVILEDVSKEANKMQKSLMHILDSRRCIKVPGYKSALPDLPQKASSKEEMDNFWNCLEFAMSKNRSNC